MTRDLLFELDLVTGVLAVLASGLVALGYLRLALSARGVMGHFAAGLLAIHCAVFLRTIYRDIAPSLIGGDGWDWLFGATGQVVVTTAINLLILYSGYHSLKALLLAIPDGKRERYTILTAALYPPWGIAAVPRALIRRLRGERP